MIQHLNRYLDRLHATIHSRLGIDVEALELVEQAGTGGRTSELHVRLRFWDGSLLRIEEALVAQALAIAKIRYNYHYQRSDGTVVFRYDNAPHHPNLPGFPEHKHERNQVQPARAPDLSDVMKEIDRYLLGQP
jgi:hypothetical protein